MNGILVKRFFANGLLVGITFGLIFGIVFSFEGGLPVGIATGLLSSVVFGMIFHFTDVIGETASDALFFGFGITLIFTFVVGFKMAVLIGVIVGSVIYISGNVEGVA